MNNKKLLIAMIVLLIIFIAVLPFMYIRKDKSTLSTLIQNKYRQEYRYTPGTNWFATINNTYAISLQSILADQKLLLKGSKKNNKTIAKLLAKSSLHKNLLIIKALEEDMLNSEDYETYIWYAVRKATADYYLRQKYAKEYKRPIPKVKQAEVNLFYKQFNTYYKKMGYTEKQAKKVIENLIAKERMRAQYQAFENKIINKLKLENTIKVKNK